MHKKEAQPGISIRCPAWAGVCRVALADSAGFKRTELAARVSERRLFRLRAVRRKGWREDFGATLSERKALSEREATVSTCSHVFFSFFCMFQLQMAEYTDSSSRRKCHQHLQPQSSRDRLQ